MRRVSIILTAVFILLATTPLGCKGEIKEPSVAGAFYPAEKEVLIKMVDDFLSRAQKGSYSGKLIALISPHAGYQYSGQIAAYAYKQLEGKNIDTVLLIGPSHHKSFDGASVYTKGSFRTPLGDVKIDENLAGRLINEKAHIVFDPDAFEREHSLEVQIPFLQRTLKKFKIVPILIGSPTNESFDFLIENLTKVLMENKNAIIIASTDLSHFHDYQTAVRLDKNAIEAIEPLSIEELHVHLVKGTGELCGAYPVIYTMAIARELGANHGILYKYANSGDVTGERSRVVGYAAVGIYRSELTKAEKEELLIIARKSIESYVSTGKAPSFDVKNPKLRAHSAVFVTINKNGSLRGCIGHIRPFMPLYQSVTRNAIAASSSDPRFNPLKKEELKDIDVEVSVLSPLEPLKDIKNIQIGKHGLYIVKGMQSGLLLPQVATKFGWDGNTFLEQVCVKAGLPKDAWKDTELYTFTAEIIK